MSSFKRHIEHAAPGRKNETTPGPDTRPAAVMPAVPVFNQAPLQPKEKNGPVARLEKRKMPMDELASGYENSGQADIADIKSLAGLSSPVQRQVLENIHTELSGLAGKTNTRNRNPLQRFAVTQLLEGKFIVEDGQTAQQGQMTKTEFLGLLRTGVQPIAREVLEPVGLAQQHCPDLNYWISYYADKPAAYFEAAMSKYASGAASVSDAQAFLQHILQRVKQGLEEHVATGSTSVEPGEVPGDIEQQRPVLPIQRKAIAPIQFGLGKGKQGGGTPGEHKSGEAKSADLLGELLTVKLIRERALFLRTEFRRNGFPAMAQALFDCERQLPKNESKEGRPSVFQMTCPDLPAYLTHLEGCSNAATAISVFVIGRDVQPYFRGAGMDIITNPMEGLVDLRMPLLRNPSAPAPVEEKYGSGSAMGLHAPVRPALPRGGGVYAPERKRMRDEALVRRWFIAPEEKKMPVRMAPPLPVPVPAQLPATAARRLGILTSHLRTGMGGGPGSQARPGSSLPAPRMRGMGLPLAMTPGSSMMGSGKSVGIDEVKESKLPLGVSGMVGARSASTATMRASGGLMAAPARERKLRPSKRENERVKAMELGKEKQRLKDTGFMLSSQLTALLARGDGFFWILFRGGQLHHFTFIKLGGEFILFESDDIPRPAINFLTENDWETDWKNVPQIKGQTGICTTEQQLVNKLFEIMWRSRHPSISPGISFFEGITDVRYKPIH